MKRWIAMLLCALLALMPALAEGLGEYPIDPRAPEIPLPDPSEDGQSDAPGPRSDVASDDTITLDINGESVTLRFDTSPQYSSIAGGLVQASFYAYGADGFTLYELYLIFPETAKPGMVLTPEYAALAGEECSVALIVSNSGGELYYFTSLVNGSVFPQGSDFTITIEDIESDAGSVTYSGSLSATLVALDVGSDEPVSTLALAPTPFRFTMTGSPTPPPAESQPGPTTDDMRKV